MLHQILKDAQAEVEEKKNNFPIFWWESNQCWGYVASKEGLEYIHKKYMERVKGRNIMLDAKHAEFSSLPTPPNFGLRGEHKGKTSLREFLTQKGFDVDTLNLDID